MPFILTVDLVHMFAVKDRGGNWQETVLQLHDSGITVSFILCSFPNNLLALTIVFGHH